MRRLLVLLLMLYSARTFGGGYPMQHFLMENGLPSNTIYSVYRDSHDFLWIATDKGVVRYNGIEFEKFTTSDGLPSNDAFFFQEDALGRLWISCYNGELCYYEKGMLHNQSNTPFLKMPFKHSFLGKAEVEPDSSLTMIFIDYNEFVNIAGKTRSTVFIKKFHLLRDTFEFPLTIRKMPGGRYSLLFAKATIIVDTTGNVVSRLPHKNNDRYAYGLSEGQRWLYSEKGIYSIDEQLMMKFTNPRIRGLFVYNIVNFDGNWFTCTTDGLFINNDIQLLKDYRVTSVCEDVEGNYWISTLNNGLFCLNKNYLATAQYNDVYTGDIKYARALDTAIYFTTGNSNLYRFTDNRPVLLFDYYKHFGANYARKDWENYLRASGHGVLLDNNGRYYNLEPGYSFVLEGVNTGRIREQSYHSNTNLVYVKELLAQNGNIYIRNSDFISMLSTSDIAMNGNLNVKMISRRTDEKRVFGMCCRADSSVWYSTFEEVNKISGGQTIRQTQFGDITFKTMYLVGNYLVGLSNKNQLVVCNNFSGNMSDSVLPGNNCIWDKLYKLNDSTFLVSTDNHYRLVRLFASTGTPRFSVQIIENSSLPVQAEYICSNDSLCYFFKNGSITRVPISSLFERHTLPRIFFRTLKTRTQSYPIKPGMEIGYSESKNITISLSPFSFGSKYLVCEYSISRDSTDYWRPLNNNEINLFQPGYGNYIVKIRARTLSGNFSAPFVFPFIIARPFWAMPWFMALAALVFIAAVLLIVRMLIIQKTRKREIIHDNEIKFLKSEYKALNALMNPHFIFNTLNNVQWLVNNGDKMTANHYLRVFSDLVRQNMNNISKELIPLQNEIDLVDNYLKLEKLRFKDAIQYEINIKEGLDLDIKIPPLLIQPLVENAIKHGLLPGSRLQNRLTVNIYEDDAGNMLYIDIRDNGIGITESQKKPRGLHKSTGLDNIRNRIEKLSLMHGVAITLSVTELQNDDGAPTGTLARVCIDIRE